MVVTWVFTKVIAHIALHLQMMIIIMMKQQNTHLLKALLLDKINSVKSKLLFLLFMLGTHLAVGQIEKIEWNKSTLPIQESFRLYSIKEINLNDSIYYIKELLFNDGKNQVRFKNDSIYAVFNFTECSATYCNPRIIDIMERVINDSFRYTNDRYNDLSLKIQFYEKYFGKLEMDGECAIFTPVEKPPKMVECKIKK